MIQQSNIRPVIYIASTMALAIVAVILLYLLTYQPNAQKNGFTRRFTKPAIQLAAIPFKKQGEIMAISGATASHFYFQTKNPERLLITDRSLSQLQYHSINLPYDKTLPPDKTIASRFHYLVDSPVIHILAGNVPAIISGDLSSGTTQMHRFPSSIYTRAAAVSPHSFALRGFDTTVSNTDQLFMKGDPVSRVLTQKNNMTEQKGDFISTDGLMHYDSTTHLITYIYFYANRIFCLDTNLNLVYKGHTIDTFSTYQTKAGTTPSGNAMIYSKIAPSRIINRENCVASGKLFNYSTVMADNEKEEQFENNSVIDIYNVQNGDYQESFYIPLYKKERLLHFKVFGNMVVALYKNYIVSYNLE